MRTAQTGSTSSTNYDMQFIKSFDQFLYEQGSLLNVGIYYDYGVVQNTMMVWSNFFRKFFSVEPTQLTSESFTHSELKKYDLVVIPGGKGYKESLGLSDEAKENLKHYVSEGGSLAAICAGAFLVTNAEEWSMGMVSLSQDRELNQKIVNETFFLDFKFTERGKDIFNTEIETLKMYFHWGPILVNSGGGVEVLLEFDDKVPGVGDYAKGKVAAAYSSYGNGKILTVSPHIEKTANYEYLIANGINYIIRNNHA